MCKGGCKLKKDIQSLKDELNSNKKIIDDERDEALSKIEEDHAVLVKQMQEDWNA